MASTDGADRGNGASGGGPIEAVFWVKDAMMQWRIKGRAFVIGNESCDAGELWSRENIQRWVRRREGSAEEDITRWTWEKEITANFANLSPTMRGSFKNPSPGTPRSEPPSDPSLKLGLTLDDIHDPVARANFRVVVIVPEEVESVDLTSPENFKRMRHEEKHSYSPESIGRGRGTVRKITIPIETSTLHLCYVQAWLQIPAIPFSKKGLPIKCIVAYIFPALFYFTNP
ncbi:conserved hypothetical protein [Histoplasma capsulatum var. duboisii H88]|uniref:Uncharacterized protein n=1 Tax=Ajellomyces capsulatus (strain H88) TaxID=544711 RepID=F0UN22_AJEC8|nr:conserved hypothetical protein [Histoplasma capsulatum var. duboisii H88]